MKTIKNEIYKGYQVEVEVGFEESTTAYVLSGTYYDSIFFKAYSYKNGIQYFTVEDYLEKKRDQRTEMYDELNKKVSSMLGDIKKKIDKVVREEEMTDGLPESLLKENKEEDVELVDAIYKVCQQAIADHEKKKVEQFKSAMHGASITTTNLL